LLEAYLLFSPQKTLHHLQWVEAKNGLWEKINIARTLSCMWGGGRRATQVCWLGL